MQKDKDLEPHIIEQINQLESASSIMVECVNVPRGCKSKQISIDKIDQHERTQCEYRYVRCERNGCSLKQTMEFHMLKIHHSLECKGEAYPNAQPWIQEERKRLQEEERKSNQIFEN